MKKIVTIMITLCCLIHLKAQQTLEDVTTLEDAKKMIAHDIETIEDIVQDRELKVITPTQKKNDSGKNSILRESSEYYVELDNNKRKDKIQNYFSDMGFYESYNYPSNTIFIRGLYDIDEAQLIKKGSLFDKEFIPDAQLRTIFYRDGSTEILNDTIFEGWIKLDKLKPIDSLEVKIDYIYPSFLRKISLSKNTPHYSNEEYIADLIKIGDNCPMAIISPKLESDSIISPIVLGVNSDGRIVRWKTSANVGHPSKKMIESFKKLLVISKEEKKNLESGKYTDVESFKEKIKPLQQELKDLIEIDYSDSKQTYCFEDNIDTLNIYYSSGYDTISQIFVLKNESFKNIGYFPINYISLRDKNTDKYGCIDPSGKVVIPFEYSYLDYLGGKLFRGESLSPYQRVAYILDTKNNRLIKQNYVLGDDSYDLTVNQQYLVVEKESGTNENGSKARSLKGVVDLDGQVVLPIQYNGIGKIHDNGFVIFSIDGLRGLYQIGVGEVLPAKYAQIEIKDQLIYTRQDLINDNTYKEINDVFDFDLKQVIRK